MMDFKRIKLSETSTKKLQQFKGRTGLTPNIACRIALGLSLGQNWAPSLELYTEESGQEINRYTLFGEHELVLLALFRQWCHENRVEQQHEYRYLLGHINRGIELLTNRVKGLDGFAELYERSNARTGTLPGGSPHGT